MTGEILMRTSVFALIMFAAAIPSLAMAGDAGQDRTPAVSAPAQMTDAEMDKVTAGGTHTIPNGPHVDKTVGQGICGPVRACP
jgi:hypothetical protein